ncbi:hypothetical protein [Stieleria marina]|uniref:Uncharacterized protein n=1 Tax=Stieleria marina TaxID=1930275 RepID=A0A517NXC2_9BACT|nr:hypothetical protein K239x_37810 [Planctomycetes bacterium K23_9]
MTENQASDSSCPETDPDARQFAEVTSGIYRRFDAESVLIALRYAVRHALTAQNPAIMLMFVRIAEVYPAARDLLQTHQSDAVGAERQAIDLVLNPPEEIRGASYLPESIQSPGEMDLCWAEFLVTGKTDAIKLVVSVLDRDDETRQFLKQKLADDSADLRFSESEQAELQHVGIGIGKLSDELGWEVMTPGDTDLFLWLGVKDQNQCCTKVLQAMDEQRQLHVATKGAAFWSLQANAAQHGIIRLLCEEAATTDGGFARKLLITS